MKGSYAISPVCSDALGTEVETRYLENIKTTLLLVDTNGSGGKAETRPWKYREISAFRLVLHR